MTGQPGIVRFPTAKNLSLQRYLCSDSRIRSREIRLLSIQTKFLLKPLALALSVVRKLKNIPSRCSTPIRLFGAPPDGCLKIWLTISLATQSGLDLKYMTTTMKSSKSPLKYLISHRRFERGRGKLLTLFQRNRLHLLRYPQTTSLQKGYSFFSYLEMTIVPFPASLMPTLPL